MAVHRCPVCNEEAKGPGDAMFPKELFAFGTCSKECARTFYICGELRELRNTLSFIGREP